MAENININQVPFQFNIGQSRYDENLGIWRTTVKILNRATKTRWQTTIYTDKAITTAVECVHSIVQAAIDFQVSLRLHDVERLGISLKPQYHLS